MINKTMNVWVNIRTLGGKVEKWFLDFEWTMKQVNFENRISIGQERINKMGFPCLEGGAQEIKWL